MPRRARRNSPNPGAQGFSLVEVLVSLVLSGILMAMVTMVMAQVVGNDETLKTLVGKTGEAATLRRILHRDLAGSSGKIEITPSGFSLVSGQNSLLSAPLPVKVEWTFQGGSLLRRESEPGIQYASVMTMVRAPRELRLEFYDLSRNTWVNINNSPDAKAVSGIRLSMVLADSSQMTIVERLPYATSF